MPVISDEEMEIFKELVRREERRKKDESVKKKLFIEELSARTNALLDLNKSYGPVEAYAVTFAKFMENDFKAQKCKELWFNWDEIKNYLTKICFTDDSMITLKTSFRRNLKDRGVCMRIDRKYNTVKIYKCQKRIKIIRQ